MTDNAASPTETSPLLATPTNPLPEPGDAPNGVLANGTANGVVKPGDDEERQAGAGDRTPQYEGMPEVKKQLKYIVPAIAIGVWHPEELFE